MISIVVIVKNEEKQIGQCINSLLSQKDIEQTEIIIVDGASSDKTADIVAGFAKTYRFIKLVKCTTFGYSFQRNVGATVAQGDYVLYISGDTIIAPNLIRRYIKAIAEGFDIIQGTVVNISDNRKFGDSMTKVYPAFYRPYIDTNYEQFSTINVLIKRELVVKNPFDETILSMEDKEWCYRIGESAKFLRLKGAIVFHVVHETFVQYCKKVYKEAITVGHIATNCLRYKNNKFNVFNWLNWCKVSAYTVTVVLLALCGTIILKDYYWALIALLIILFLSPLISTVQMINVLPKQERLIGSLIIYVFYWMVVFGIMRGRIATKLDFFRKGK